MSRENRTLSLPQLLDIIKPILDSGKLEKDSQGYNLYLTETMIQKNTPCFRATYRIWPKIPKIDERGYPEWHINLDARNKGILESESHRTVYLEEELKYRMIHNSLIKVVDCDEIFTRIFGLSS